MILWVYIWNDIRSSDFVFSMKCAARAVATLPFLISLGKVIAVPTNDTNINQTNKRTVMNKPTSSIHIFDLDGAKPQFSSPTGSRTIMNADNLPILAGIGAVLLRLQKGHYVSPLAPQYG
jgi:hypothetical protein